MKVVRYLSLRWWWKLVFIGDGEKGEDCRSMILEAAAAAGAGVFKVPRNFSFQELQSATNNFDRINRGENLACFRGKLGVETIVVRLVQTSKQNKSFKELFADEMLKMSEIQHKNLAEVQGFCLHKSSLFLVYRDFMSIGSLDKLLLNKSSGTVSWASRLQILQDVARGLAHLHSNKVLHLDVKPQNVFLDSDMHATVSDFGFFKLEKRCIIRGTPGYMPPEWLQMRVSEKTDVYSFGILLLEVVSGVRLIHWNQQIKRHLGNWAFQMARMDELKLLIDPSIAREVCNCSRQVEDVIRVGLWCIQANERLRPSMSSTLGMLRREREVFDPPLQPLEPAGMIDMDFTLSLAIEMMQLQQQPLKRSRYLIDMKFNQTCKTF